MKPRLFAIPAAEPNAASGNILRRCQYALSLDEYIELLNHVSPARKQVQSVVLSALELYVFNRVGPLFPIYTDEAQRDHFLPHTGLWAPVRRFADPRVMTQLWLHTAVHEWYGWPLPVNTSFFRYRKASFTGEILAVIESEYNFFHDGGGTTAGMFNPAYPSTYEALCAVGIKGAADAHRLLLQMQFDGGRLPRFVTEHPGFKEGVAVTLHRQGAWAEHDEVFVRKHWEYQRRAGYPRAYRTLWGPDRQTAIFKRQQHGREGILQYHRDVQEFDALEGLRAVVKSMLRVMALDMVQQPVEQDSIAKRITSMFADVVASNDANYLRDMADVLPEIYDEMLGPNAIQFPAPIWDLALDFRTFRVAWEARLKEKTMQWSQQE